jgi:hypothetical protein
VQPIFLVGNLKAQQIKSRDLVDKVYFVSRPATKGTLLFLNLNLLS